MRRIASDARLSGERSAWAAEWFPLAMRIAKRSSRRGPSHLDEFRSRAGEMLCRAAIAWNPSFGVGFRHYAADRVKREMRNVLHDLRPAGYRRRDSGDPPAVDSFGDLDVLPMPDVPAVDPDPESAFSSLVSRAAPPLDARQAEAVRLVHLGGLNRRQMAAALGMTDSGAWKLYNRAVAALARGSGRGGPPARHRGGREHERPRHMETT